MTQTPTTSIEECDLIRRLLFRQEHAWQEFVDRFQRLVFSQVCRTASRFHSSFSQAEIEDLSATVFSQLLRNDMQTLRSFDGRSRLGTWLTVVTRRIALRELGKRQRELNRQTASDAIPQDSLEGTHQDALSKLIEDEDQQRLKVSIESLEDVDRKILELFYEQNMGYREISQELGISVNTVGPKLNRAHKRLRKRMRWS